MSIANVRGNDTVTFDAGDNIAITQTGRGLSVALARDISVNSVTTRDLTATGNVTLGGGAGTSVKVASGTTVNMGGNRIQNVGNATADTDAANMGDVKRYVNTTLAGFNATATNSAVNNLNKRVNKLDKRMRGYAANAMAATALPQVTAAGESMVSAAVGSQGGASAVAVGYSRALDNGKVIIKLNGAVSSNGEAGVGAGVGYKW